MYYPQPPMPMPRPMAAPPMATPPMGAPPMAAKPIREPKSSGGAVILFLLVVLLIGAITGYFFVQNKLKQVLVPELCNSHKTSVDCTNDSNCKWDASSLTCKRIFPSAKSYVPESAPLPPPTPPEEIVEVPGCMIPEANNYNSDATIEDDSCTFDPPPPDEIVVDTTPDKIFCRQDQKITCTSNPPQKVPDPESCLPNTDSLSVYCTSKGDETSCLEKVGYGGPLCIWDSSSNLCDINENNANVACNMIFKAGDSSKCLTDTDNDLSVVEKCERIMIVEGEEDLCSQVVLGQTNSETECTSIMSSSDTSVPACSYTNGDIQSLCIYTPPPDPRCSCEDCPEGYQSSIDFVGDDKALNDRFAMSTECEPIPMGGLKCSPGQRVKHPNDNGEENYPCSDGLCVCEDCLEEETYGCPVNLQNKRDTTMQPSPQCEHEADKVEDSSVTTKCYRRKCSAELTSEYTYEKMVKNGNVYSCEPCEVVNDIPYVSDGSEVSPDFALDEHLSECEISDSETDRLVGYCNSGTSEFNESWSFSDYMEWSNRVYNDNSNKSSWLPKHEELKKHSGKWCTDCRSGYVITKNGIDKNMTNKDVYYGSLTSVPNEFKYSYLNDNGQWIHLCDCKYDASDIQASSNAAYSNGFTNCKCAKSQYVDITSPISDKDNLNCNVIDSPCWKQGNYWYSPKTHNKPPIVDEPHVFKAGQMQDTSIVNEIHIDCFYDRSGTLQQKRNICKQRCEDTNGCKLYYTRDRDDRCCLKGFSSDDLKKIRNGSALVNIPNVNIGLIDTSVYDPSQLIPGAFWNIMDPYCSFLSGNSSSDFDLDDHNIIDRCCIGCNHKVYKDGIVGDDNEYETSGTLPPSYANNWLDLVNVTAPGLSPIVFNKTDDPIFVPSSSLDDPDVHNMNKINLRNHDKSIGFNSRPVFYYPDFRHQTTSLSAEPDSLYANYNTVSDVEFHVSKNIINGAAEARHGGDTGGEALALRKDPSCVNQGASQCGVKQNYNIMTKNIFTCNRTNPLPLINKTPNALIDSEDISLSQWDNFDTAEWDDQLRKYYIPPFTVVGDEQFYNVPATNEQKSMYLTNYDLEYPGRGWIPKNAVGIERTHIVPTVRPSGRYGGSTGSEPHHTACRGTSGSSVGNGSPLSATASHESSNKTMSQIYESNHGRKMDPYRLHVNENDNLGRTAVHNDFKNKVEERCNQTKTQKYGISGTCKYSTTKTWDSPYKLSYNLQCSPPNFNPHVDRINGYQKEENKNYYNKEKTASPITEGPSVNMIQEINYNDSQPDPALNLVTNTTSSTFSIPTFSNPWGSSR